MTGRPDASALGPLIGISPLGWLLAASALPLASNSSYFLLSLAAAGVSTLCCILALDLAWSRAATRTGTP